MLPGMDFNGSTLQRLSLDECMALMASASVGRIVYTWQALPAVALVSFALLDGDIVIRANAGGELATATRQAVVAFEADSVDSAGHLGWSVTVVGHSRAVTGSQEIQGLERVALISWRPEGRHHYIRISPAIAHGRQLSAPQVGTSSQPR